MKIATWNINSIKTRLQHLRDYVAAANPDILLLQEIKCETDRFPYDELADLPYNYYVSGEKSYNGVAIFSKIPAEEIIYKFPNNPCAHQARFLEISCNTAIGFCRFISVYVPNGGEVNSEKFLTKLDFYDALTEYLKDTASYDIKTIVGGDFNVAPFDIDVYSPQSLASATCFTQIEKQKLRSLLNTGFEDLYRLIHSRKQEFSWWDYRAGSFEQNKGMRIDMLLASSNMAGDFKNCHMDYAMRTRTKPSDHIPVLAY